MSRSATHDRLLALTPRRALAIFRTLPANPCIAGKRHPREKVHFPHITAPRGAARAGKRTFPAYHCTRKISCKDMGEVYDDLQRYGGNERKTACRTCRKTLISPTSLHEISQMQGYGGNARKRVRPAPGKASMIDRRFRVPGKRNFRFSSPSTSRRRARLRPPGSCA